MIELKKTKRVRTTFNGGETITQKTNRFAFFDNINDSYSNLSFINPQRLMPDMKIIDFLSDIFKTYNLVAFEERLDDNSYLINVKSYDDYLDDGNQYDITNYVDVSSSTVSRISPFKEVKYTYPDPKTFLAINQKEITRFSNKSHYGLVTYKNRFDFKKNIPNKILLF